MNPDLNVCDGCSQDIGANQGAYCNRCAEDFGWLVEDPQDDGAAVA